MTFREAAVQEGRERSCCYNKRVERQNKLIRQMHGTPEAIALSCIKSIDLCIQQKQHEFKHRILSTTGKPEHFVLQRGK